MHRSWSNHNGCWSFVSQYGCWHIYFAHIHKNSRPKTVNHLLCEKENVYGHKNVTKYINILRNSLKSFYIFSECVLILRSTSIEVIIHLRKGLFCQFLILLHIDWFITHSHFCFWYQELDLVKFFFFNIINDSFLVQFDVICTYTYINIHNFQKKLATFLDYSIKKIQVGFYNQSLNFTAKIKTKSFTLKEVKLC